MTTNALVLETIVRRSGRHVSRTRLLKLAYMADLIAWRVLGAPISRFNYHWHHHGPFDGEFYCAMEELASARRVTLDSLTTNEGHDCVLVCAATAPPSPQASHFTRGQIHILDYAIKQYLGLPLKDLLAVVYETEPMKSAERNDPLPMEAQRNRDKDDLGGICLETVLESREQFARGEHVTLEALKSEFAGRE